MNEFMKIILSLSLSGTLLLLFISGIKRLYKNKFSRRWQYYIWLVVALRFLLPFTSDTTIVGSLFETFDRVVMANVESANPNQPAAENVLRNEYEQTREDQHRMAAAHELTDICTVLLFIWAAAALALLVRKITLYQSFIRYIKAGNTEVSDIRILNLLSDCEENLNIKTRVELYQNALISSPMLVGFFHPSIVLPVKDLEDKELSYIFMHELVHCRQKDMFYKWLIQIVICMHWFNPFVYLLEKEVNRACELSCDEKVLSVLGENARREYGDVLLSFLKSNNLYKSSLASVTLTEGAEQVKERLGAIMKFKKKTKTMLVVTAISTVAVCGCFFITGAYAAPSADRTVTVRDGDFTQTVIDEDCTITVCDGEDNGSEAENMYEPFGLTEIDEKLYYDGKLVRSFDDQIPAEDSVKVAISYYEKDGVIDVHAVREYINGVNKLTGIEVGR